ncbi:MAG TPA: S8 family serine peptidase, partial [Afifellaceae bacterium]|nr:S8 family serine peptidase [Afifellaceae bacterium]
MLRAFVAGGLAGLALCMAEPSAAQSNGGYRQSYDRRPAVPPRAVVNPRRVIAPRQTERVRAAPVVAPARFPAARPVLLPEQLEGHPYSRFLYGSHQPEFLCVLMIAGTGDAGAEALAAANGLTVEPGVPATLLPFELYRMQLPPGRQAHEVAANLATDPNVEAVGPDYYYGAGQDAGRGVTQFALDRMHIAEARRLASGNNVVVAVIDTGIDNNHPELRDVAFERFDALGEAAADAPLGHGTATAGVIASGRDLVGIAP